jgi:hypothetical protein
MIYHTVLVGCDGFSKEDDLVMKNDMLPQALFVSRENGCVGFYKFDPCLYNSGQGEEPRREPRRFYFITSFYALGKNIALFREIL